MSTDASDVPPGPIARVDRPKAAARDWYDVISPWYDAVAGPFEASARTAGLSLLSAAPGECVLDVGCGTGTALVELARAVGPTGLAVGIDIADGMCHSSRAALSDRGLLDRSAVVLGDAGATPFPADAFDGIFASFVLELFDTPSIPTVLAEWRRILSPDGHLCVVSLSRRSAGLSTLVYESIHGLVPTAVDCRPIYVRDTLVDAGFRIEAERVDTVWLLPVEVVRCRPE